MSRDNNLVSRREVIRGGLLGLAGMAMADRLWTHVLAGTKPAGAKARSVIQIWLWGGPSHLDTFDPKPEAGYDYCGPLAKPIATNGPQTRSASFCPCWPSRPTSIR